MELENGKISGSQLTFSIGCFIQGSTLLSAFVLSVTKQDTWFVVLTGFAASICIIGIYIALTRRHPDKTIVQIFEAVFGTFIGKAISLSYIFYFLSLACLNSRDVGNFVVGLIMPETPIIAPTIMFVLVCSWAVSKGVETLTRYGYLFVVITFIVNIFIFLLLIKEMNFNAFLPAFTMPALTYVQGTHVVASIPFCEIVAFLMIAPSLKNQEKMAGSFLSGLAIGGITLFIIVVRDIASLGNMISYVTLPSYEAVKLIDIAHILTRMEVLYAIELLFLQFFKVSILYYATVLGISQVFNLRSYKPNVLTVGIIIICFSLIIFDSPMENAFWGPRVAPFFNIIFQLVFPVIALFIDLIRSMFKKSKVGQS